MSFTRNIKGQALVETALVLPVIFMLIFGFIELSFIISEKQKLIHMASYAVQTLSLTNDDSKAVGAINESYDIVPGGTKTFVQYEIISKDENDNILLSEDRRFGDIVTLKLRQDIELPIKLPFAESKINIMILTSEASIRIVCNSTTDPYTCEYAS